MINNLKEKFNFINFIDQVHIEHSTETQFPFIKYYLPKVQVVELIYGDIEYEKITKIIEEVLNEKENFVVISTDLSHFYNLEKAKQLDDICIDAIENLSIDTFNKGCEACGRVGVKAIINWAKQNNAKTRLIDYSTSETVTKDDTRVVGYGSFLSYFSI
jgi:AmmeMemoRadiSam system protein B